MNNNPFVLYVIIAILVVVIFLILGAVFFAGQIVFAIFELLLCAFTLGNQCG